MNIKGSNEVTTELKPDYRGELAREAREKLGYTQQKMADYLGLTRNGFQKKEQNEKKVLVGETYLFWLILDKHPEYRLIRRSPDNQSPAQKAADAAITLAQHLSEGVVLPSKVHLLFTELSERINAFHQDWNADIEKSVGNSLPPAKTELEELRDQLELIKAENGDLKKRLNIPGHNP